MPAVYGNRDGLQRVRTRAANLDTLIRIVAVEFLQAHRSRGFGFGERPAVRPVLRSSSRKFLCGEISSQPELF
jgi:hypothetical protein